MPFENSNPFALSRRRFLATGTATLAAAAAPFGAAHAQAPARWRRRSISGPDANLRALESYRVAVRAMLALPVSDPRNWYRQALVHAMDCPHGNWWFLVWHRGFLGWFEQICRELSRDPEFALPYWDWTAEPRLPAVMFDDVLTPTNRLFIDQAKQFRIQFQDAIAKAEYWRRAGPGETAPNQFAQLLTRRIRLPDDLWFDLLEDPNGSEFFEGPRARGLSRERPEFEDVTRTAVSMPTIEAALAPRDFVTFGSGRAQTHGGVGEAVGVLEGQCHNLVHVNVGGVIGNNNYGGFMQANLSPIDPIFYLHHANVDRLWDVWTRKQLARGLPILPDNTPPQPGGPPPDFQVWANEPFLFFVDGRGQRVTKVLAGDYAAIGDFNYDYQPGSGEQVVAAPPAAAAAAARSAAPSEQFAARIGTKAIGGTTGNVNVPGALLQAGAAPEAARLYARVTVQVSQRSHGVPLPVTINVPQGQTAGPGSPYYAGSLVMFGHHGDHGPVTFLLPMAAPVAEIRRTKSIGASEPLNIRVGVDARSMATHGGAAQANVVSIVVESH
jgi:tyrosinase